MSRSPEIPPSAVVLRTYAELRAEVEAFYADYYDELLRHRASWNRQVGRISATHDPRRCCYIEGNTKPLAAYIEAWRERDKLLVFDDAEGLWVNDNGRHLMRQLTQHTTKKYVQWLSTAKDLKRNGVPTSFTTTSKCAFVMNRFIATRSDQFYAAILDRGHVFYFEPSAVERHRYAASWFYDQEIHDFIGANLNMVNTLTERTYNLLAQKKAAGHDWRQYFLDRFCRVSVLQVVQRLENDDSFPTVEQRVREFARLGFGSRRTYFNYRGIVGSRPVADCSREIDRCTRDSPRRLQS